MNKKSAFIVEVKSLRKTDIFAGNDATNVMFAERFLQVVGC